MNAASNSASSSTSSAVPARGKQLRSALREFRSVKAVGKALAQSLGVLATLVGALFLLGLVDFVYALGQNLRLVLMGLLVAAFLGVFFWRLLRSLKVSERELAAQVDEQTSNERHSFLSAWELGQQQASDRKLEEYLRQQSLREGEKELEKVQAKNFWPTALVVKGGALLLVVGGLVGLCFALFPEQSQIHALRVLAPFQDRAPWSPLNFVVSPEKAEVVYGQGLVFDVQITGGELEELPKARIVTSLGEREMPTYELAQGSYRLSLDSITEDMTVAFQAGRGRSEWQSVEVLLEPRVLGAELDLTPPSYSGQSPNSGLLPAEGVVGLVGTQARLVLESNRPLGGGTLELIDEETGEVLQSIDGEVVGENQVSYSWNLQKPALVRANLRDIRGTAESIEFPQQVKADAVPVVQLDSPSSLMLATPDSKLVIEGQARDDIGLERVDFVRALVGYRDRSRNLSRSVGKTDFEFGQPLALADLGVKPGDQLEFYLQATDGNPVLTGMGVSELSRVIVISEEDYAQRLRDQTTLEEFSAKFAELNELLEEARQSLENLQEAAKGDEQAKQEKLEQAQEAAQEAQEMFEAIAKDFPAYDLEKDLGEAAQEMQKALEQNQQDLQEMNSNMSSEQIQQQAQEMLQRLGQQQEEFEQLQEQAEEIAQMGQLMQMSSEFAQIYQTQLSLAQRMNSIAEQVRRGNMQNLDQLVKLGETQQGNRERLDAWERELEKRLENLPEELSPAMAQMATEAQQFLEYYRAQGIPPVMDEASDQANVKNASRAYNQAQMAEALLRQMMNMPGNCMGGMCKGQMPSFAPGMTLQQMLNSMLNRGRSQGSGMGSGIGASGAGQGGTGSSGYGIQSLGVEVPMVGPGRMRFQSMGGGSGNQGRGGEKGVQVSEDAMSQINPEATREQEQGKLDLEQVPEAYRDAVKLYFSELPE